jgi:hypothetical protein
MMLVDAPARQNATAMHTRTSSRSNSGGGGLNGSPRLSRFIHEMGKTCRRRAVPYLGGFRRVFALFGSPEAQMQAAAVGCGNKSVLIQRLFKFSLS